MEVVEVISEIHHGGFGVIHKVMMKDGSIVARKTFQPLQAKIMAGKDIIKFKKRFSREVKIQKRLPSEFFIPIIYASLDEEIPWFIMPLADSDYNKEILNAREEQRHPEGLADILNSLEYIHKLGYVHRDLKPGNILFHDGRWKLADLGLITADKTLTSSFQTSENFYAGSQPYMAPEQVTNFSGVTHHSDIYSFGAILHDIFNGAKRVPYQRLSSSGSIGWIIEKCTDENPKRRFKDVRTIRDVLLAHLSKEENGTKPSAQTAEWIEQLKTLKSWDRDKLDTFIMYLESNEDSHQSIFMETTLVIIEVMPNIDKVLWKQFLLLYFDWIFPKHFNFDYCDVVVGHIYKAFSITTDLEIKSRAALTAAELGRYHNRWYVMQQVIKMCSPHISDNFAIRLNIEIHVEGKRAKENLKRCAEAINLSIKNYHPEVIDAIEN